jgi:hypothetical protein
VKIEVLVHGGKIGEEDLAKARVAGPILGAGKFPSVLFPLADQGGKADDLLAGRPFEDGRLSGRDPKGFHGAEFESEFLSSGVDDETVAAFHEVVRGMDLEDTEAGFLGKEDEKEVLAFVLRDREGNLRAFPVAAPEIEKDAVPQGGLEGSGDGCERNLEAFRAAPSPVRNSGGRPSPGSKRVTRNWIEPEDFSWACAKGTSKGTTARARMVRIMTSVFVERREPPEGFHAKAAAEAAVGRGLEVC